MRVTSRIRGGQGFSRKLRQLQERLTEQHRVYVGIPRGAGNSEDGTPLVQIGAIHEFGAKHIPERSFLREPLLAKQKDLAKVFRQLMPRVARGELTLLQALDQVGAKAASISQEAISAGISPANDPKTVKRKGSSKPLIDTGRLRQAVTWEIRHPRDVE